MGKKTKTAQFIIPGLLSAGAFAADAIDQDKNIQKPESFGITDKIKSLVSEISKQHTHTLAGHSSHSSHGSHGSHGSHSSHSSYSGLNLQQIEGIKLASDDHERTLENRNESSTPRNSILPSSPAITEPRKLKKLPGNSKKFAKIVSRAQIALATQGIYSGAIDGTMDARTIAAVFEYQTKHGLVSTGKLDSDTLSALGIPAT